jgi:alkylhydroperoxidase family enzyme
MSATGTIHSDNVAAILEPGGELTQAYERVWQSLWQQPHVPGAVLELCRLRIARMHGADADLAAPPRMTIDEGPRQAVLSGSYARDDRISPAERAAVEFAEVYAMDAQAITDELAQAVVAHYGEPGLVALIEALGFIDGRIRLSQMLGPLLTGAGDRA